MAHVAQMLETHRKDAVPGTHWVILGLYKGLYGDNRKSNGS